MAIFNKSVDDLSFEDLNELLEGGSVENVLLEFKKEAPGRDETLKKLSAFANTFGGHMVVGAVANSETGVLESLPGVEAIAGYKQKVVSWCLAQVTPPVTAMVSPPIAVPETDRVCYVVYVPISLIAPHFLAARQGSYIRTDEFSTRFEPQLATLPELQHLLDRRATAIEARGTLRNRSLKRFEALVTTKYADDPHTEGEIGPRLHLTVVPSYPVADLVDEAEVYRLGREVNVAWRQVGFPRIHADRITQRGSVIAFRAGGTFSQLEVSTTGHLHYASELYGLRDGTVGIHFGSLMGEQLVFLRYAAKMFAAMKYFGPVTVTVRLEGVQGVPILYSSMGFMETGPASPLDDVIEFTVDTDSGALQGLEEHLAKDLMISLLFALNWADAIELNSLRALTKWAYEYNGWSPPVEK